MCYYVLVSTNLLNEMALSACDTQSQDTINLLARPTVKRESITNPLPEQDSGKLTNSQQIQEKIDNLIKLQEQYLILELARIDRMIRERGKG